jgi:mRNA interferase RelE/StbE
MKYRVELKPRAVKDLKELTVAEQARIFHRIQSLENNLAGDVKRLTHFTPAFRLRVGRYRILFEVNADRVIIYRVIHRKDAYS